MAEKVIRKSDISGKTGAEPLTVEWRGDMWRVDLTAEEAEDVLSVVRQGALLSEEKIGWEGFAAKFRPKTRKR